MGWHWHQLDHMQITGTLLQTDNDASISSLELFTDQMLFLMPKQHLYECCIKIAGRSVFLWQRSWHSGGEWHLQSFVLRRSNQVRISTAFCINKVNQCTGSCERVQQRLGGPTTVPCSATAGRAYDSIVERTNTKILSSHFLQFPSWTQIMTS